MASKKEKNNNSRQQQSMTKEQKKALKTVQQSIPIVRIYEDGGEKSPLTGVIETADGVFTKSYMIYDTNYSDADIAEYRKLVGEISAQNESIKYFSDKFMNYEDSGIGIAVGYGKIMLMKYTDNFQHEGVD